MLILLFVGGFSALAKAQLLLSSPAIDIGYGGFTPPILSGEVKNRTQFFTGGTQGDYTVTSTGAFHAKVTASIWKIRVGVVGSYEVITVGSDYSYSNNGSPINPAYVKTNNSYWTGMALVQWNYWSIPRLHIYGGLAGGYYGVHSTLKENTNTSQTPDNSTSDHGFAYQVSAVGVDLGSKKLSVFLEGGWGYLGCVNGGIRFKL